MKFAQLKTLIAQEKEEMLTAMKERGIVVNTMYPRCPTERSKCMVIESERSIQTKILRHLKKRFPKAVVWKLHEDPVFGVVGIPDILFIHHNTVYFFEVKRPGEKPTKIQDVVMQRICNNGIVADVVYGIQDVERILECQFG